MPEAASLLRSPSRRTTKTLRVKCTGDTRTVHTTGVMDPEGRCLGVALTR
jgi:hypothetical protein